MSRLPVIIGMGGVNPAGRTSFHYGYQRMVFDALNESDQARTLKSLGSLMGVSPEDRDYILNHTLIRKLEDTVFDGDNIPLHRRLTAESDVNHPLRMTVKRKHLPLKIPENWQITESPEEGRVTVEVKGATDLLIPDTRVSVVKSCGQLPTGFSAESLYPSRHHPKALAMTVYGASDAMGSLGIDWERIRQRLDPDDIGVFAGSGMSQLDSNGYGGMMQARLLGKQVTPKSLPLGLPEMPADFINAYVIGNVGHTGCNIGACATFLYNLRQGMDAIKSGRCRLVIVGNSETGLVPEVFEGYGNMGALATDAELLELDKAKGISSPDYQRASRPFSYNCGFTLSESAQFFVLCDDELALELGATIYGAIPNVFVHADGFKKSIPSPGVGNYLTVAKSVAYMRSMLGEKAIQQRSYMVAHGTSTPQNRTTESMILNETAKVFDIDKWIIAANKCYVGHPLSPASGDQLAMVLGSFNQGIIPGIATIDEVAEDVNDSNLNIRQQHHEVGRNAMDVAFINSKGFGGNNATGSVMAPHIVESMIEKRVGCKAFNAYLARNEKTKEKADQYDQSALSGEAKPTYLFDHNVLTDNDVSYTKEEIRLPGFDRPVKLPVDNEYSDWLGEKKQ